MSSTAIIALIVGILVILVAYAFISQTLERKRKQRQRLLTALRLRCKDFKFMVSGFPDGFLPKDLHILVYQCLVETCGRLCELEPGDKSHQDDLALFTQQLSEARQRPGNSPKRKALTSPAQVKEVTTLLQVLHNFIAQQQQRGLINDLQAQQHASQIKQLTVQITVDSHLLSARHALNHQKHRLAIHFYTLAKKLLAKESGEVNYQKQILQLNGAIAKLEQLLAEQPASETQPVQGSSEWAEFEKESAWQRKTLYDD